MIEMFTARRCSNLDDMKSNVELSASVTTRKHSDIRWLWSPVPRDPSASFLKAPEMGNA